jgi:hypothetical protein
MASRRTPAERDFSGDILDLLTEAKESLGADEYLELLTELGSDLETWIEEAKDDAEAAGLAED